MEDRKAKIKNLMSIFQRIEQTEEEIDESMVSEEKK